MSISDPIPVSLGASTSTKQKKDVDTLTSPRVLTTKINPSPRRRLLILLSFPLVFLLAVPYWWYTTSIERLPLPVDRIAALENAPLTDVKSTILLTAAEDAYPKAPADKAQYTSKDICEALGKLVTKGIDGIYGQERTKGVRHWDIVYEWNRRSSPALHIHLLGSDTANTSFPLQPYVQAPGMGMLPDKVKPGTLVIPIHPNQIKDRFLRDHIKIAMINSIQGLYPSNPPEIALRALKYSPNITLSFVLLNEDFASGSYVRSWDVEGAIRDHFLPHLEPLRPVFNFSIESQVLYHAPLSFEPTWGPLPHSRTIEVQAEKALKIAASASVSEENSQAEDVAVELMEEAKREEAWLVDDEMAKVFVNSEKWSLDSGSSQNPVLRFLLFIPSSAHRPLHLSSRHSANSFLLPQYGSVVILNPPSSTPSSETYSLPSSALVSPFHLFTSHLYSLLALPDYPLKLHHSPPSNPLKPPTGLREPFSRWQLETVLRQRMRENEVEAKKTLAGIIRLVKKIKEMKVEKGVRDMVLGSVERLEKMAKTKDPLQAFILSRDAVGLANQAFFDPSMMGLLYFPNEHKFAVYTPLFAPVAVPMIIGLLKELLGWYRRKKRQNETDEAETQNGQHEETMTAEDVRSEVGLEVEVETDGVGGDGSNGNIDDRHERNEVDAHEEESSGRRALRSRKARDRNVAT